MLRHGLAEIAARAGEPLDREQVARWVSSLDDRGLEEIEELRVARRQLDDAALGPLATPLLAAPGQRGLQRLRALELSGNLLTDRGCVLLAECAAALRRRPNAGLVTLLLAGNQIGPEGAEALAMSFFPPGTSSGDSEYTLSLSENPIGDSGVAAVATAVRIRGCQVALHLCDVGCSEDGCNALAESLRHISLLDLGKNPVPEPALETLALAMGPPLRHLGLSRLTTETGRGLLGGEGAAALALSEGLARSGAPLEVLDLGGDSLEDLGLRALADALATPSAPALRDIDLAYNRIRDGNLLANFLAGGGRRLVNLNLEANELNDLALFAFAAGISLSTSLRRLNLARNRFSDSGAVALAQAVRHQCSAGTVQRASAAALQLPAVRRWLQQLGASGNKPHLQEFKEPGIRGLDLSFNMVTDEGAQAFAEVPCLVRLSLYDTSIGGPGREALLGAIRASHVRVERAVTEVYTALGAGSGPLPSQLPWPLVIEGLGLEQLEADFAARAKAWADIPLTQSSRGSPQPQPQSLPSRAAPAVGHAVGTAGSLPVEAGFPAVAAAPGRPTVEAPVEEGAAASAGGGRPSTDAVGASTVAQAQRVDDGSVAVASSVPAPGSSDAGSGKPASRTDAVLERARKALQKVGSRNALPAAPQPAAPKVGQPVAPKAAHPAAPKAVPPPVAAAAPEAPAQPRVSSPAGSRAITQAAPPSQAGASNRPLSRAEAVMSRARSALLRAQEPEPDNSEIQVSAPTDPAWPIADAMRPTDLFTQQDNGLMQPPVEGVLAPPSLHVMDSSTLSTLSTVNEKVQGEAGMNAADTVTVPVQQSQQAEVQYCATSGGEGTTLADSTATEANETLHSSISIIPEQSFVATAVPGSVSQGGPQQALSLMQPAPDVEPAQAAPTLATQQTFSNVGEGARPAEAATPLPREQATQLAAEAKGPPPVQPMVPPPSVAPVPLSASALHALSMVDPQHLAMINQMPHTPWTLVPVPRGKGSAPAPPPPAKGSSGAKAKGVPPAPKAPKGPPKAPPAKAQPKGSKASANQPNEESNSKAPFHRKLYWKPIDIADAEGTIFDDKQRGGGTVSTPRLDIEALTRMFEGDREKSAKLTRRSTALLNKVQLKSVGVKLVSDHRARNMAIVLKRLPVSTKELTRILQRLAWEATMITTDDLEQIIEVIPTKEECEKLRDYRSPEARTLLRDVEQMILPLSLVSRGAARVRLMCIARSARAQFGVTARTLASIRAACHAIHRSAMLREVMILALDLGNYINHGDSSKGAKAIAVGSLLTLKDFKTGRMSSLHFLCASMIRSHPQRDAAEALAKELRPVAIISKLQVQTLQAAMRAFLRDFEVITLECRNYLQEYEAAGESADEPEEQCQDGHVEELEEYEAMALSETPDFNEEDATRFVEDVMKIRGSASRRLQCMRRVVEKLSKLLRVDMEHTAEQAHAALRFCGVSTPSTKEVPTEFEALLQQLSEFIRVFRHHWNEVKEDMSSYQQLFGDRQGEDSMLKYTPS